MSDTRRIKKTSRTEVAELAASIKRLLSIAGQGLGATLTIPEFCELERISRGMFYKMRREGRAPRTMIHSDGCIRISPQARVDWHRERETETEKTERARM
jgi:hypothetical protein